MKKNYTYNISKILILISSVFLVIFVYLISNIIYTSIAVISTIAFYNINELSRHFVFDYTHIIVVNKSFIYKLQFLLIKKLKNVLIFFIFYMIMFLFILIFFDKIDISAYSFIEGREITRGGVLYDIINICITFLIAILLLNLLNIFAKRVILYSYFLQFIGSVWMIILPLIIFGEAFDWEILIETNKTVFLFFQFILLIIILFAHLIARKTIIKNPFPKYDIINKHYKPRGILEKF